MIDKACTRASLMELFRDRQTILVGGFGTPGTPFTLINALLDSGRSQLTLIKNEANEDHLGVSKLIEAGRVDKMIVSHLGVNAIAMGLLNCGEIQVEFYPQGILAEKIRAGGAGLFGFVTDIGIDTILKKGKELIKTSGGRELILEPALRGDIALIHAAQGDRYGNLVYEKSARNFNPAMATAADIVIAEVEQLVETGTLLPDSIHTPGAFVDHVVAIGELTSEYGVLYHHVV